MYDRLSVSTVDEHTEFPRRIDDSSSASLRDLKAEPGSDSGNDPKDTTRPTGSGMLSRRGMEGGLAPSSSLENEMKLLLALYR